MKRSASRILCRTLWLSIFRKAAPCCRDIALHGSISLPACALSISGAGSAGGKPNGAIAAPCSGRSGQRWVLRYSSPPGLVWANLWHRDPKSYLPYLTSGMVCWVMFSTICMDGCVTFIVTEKLLRQLRISYTLLACANVWRNAVLFFHNLTIYLLICLYAGVPFTLGDASFHSRLCAVLASTPSGYPCCLARLCARFRDVQQMVGTLLQISLFLTPIFWSPNQLTGRTAMVAATQPTLSSHRRHSRAAIGQVPPDACDWFAVILIAIIGWTMTIQMLTKFRQRIVYWL